MIQDAIVKQLIVSKVKGWGKKFSEEIGCPIEEIRFMIAYDDDGTPYYVLFHNNVRIRQVSVEEIIKGNDK